MALSFNTDQLNVYIQLHHYNACDTLVVVVVFVQQSLIDMSEKWLIEAIYG